MYTTDSVGTLLSVASTNHFLSTRLSRKTRHAMKDLFLEATYVCGMEENLSSPLFKNGEWEP